MWDEESGCFDPCTPGHSSSGWGHWPLADAGSLSGIPNSDWPQRSSGVTGAAERGAEFSLAERRAFLLLLLLHFLGRGKVRGAPEDVRVAMADAWVSLVSTGVSREFTGVLLECTVARPGAGGAGS